MMNEPWSNTLQNALEELGLQPLNDAKVLVGSDYSGGDGTVWWSAGFLILRGNGAPNPLESFARFVEAHGKIPSYKKVRTHPELERISAFLKMLNSLQGHAVVFGSRSKLWNLTFADQVSHKLRHKGVFRHNWGKQEIERMGRICHVLSRLLQTLSSPHAQIHWLTDRDPICDTPEKRADLVSTINSFHRRYSGEQAGNVLLATTEDDTINELHYPLRDAADLIAGYFNTKLSSNKNWAIEAQRGMMKNFSASPQTRQDRYDMIDEWFSVPSNTLTKNQFAIDEDEIGIRLHRFR